eukprot:COSAG01_NODE_792_length_13554_cov_13.811891_13_plen_54_part_00
MEVVEMADSSVADSSRALDRVLAEDSDAVQSVVYPEVRLLACWRPAPHHALAD